MPVPFHLTLSCVIAAVAAAGGAQAQSRDEGPVRGAQWARANQDAMGDSIRRVRSEARGQVLSAERMHMDGREINRIKVMDDRGRVRVYEDDPQQRGMGARARTRSRDD